MRPRQRVRREATQARQPLSSAGRPKAMAGSCPERHEFPDFPPVVAPLFLHSISSHLCSQQHGQHHIVGGGGAGFDQQVEASGATQAHDGAGAVAGDDRVRAAARGRRAGSQLVVHRVGDGHRRRSLISLRRCSGRHSALPVDRTLLAHSTTGCPSYHRLFVVVVVVVVGNGAWRAVVLVCVREWRIARGIAVAAGSVQLPQEAYAIRSAVRLCVDPAWLCRQAPVVSRLQQESYAHLQRTLY
jgi:hypothetical protein